MARGSGSGRTRWPGSRPITVSRQWKVDTFKISNDPWFEQLDVVGLYLKPPARPRCSTARNLMPGTGPHPAVPAAETRAIAAR